MGTAHQKRQRLSPDRTTRRGENRRFGGCPSAPAPGAYTAYKYAGDRKTEGLQPENEVKWLRVCPPEFKEEN